MLNNGFCTGQNELNIQQNTRCKKGANPFPAAVLNECTRDLTKRDPATYIYEKQKEIMQWRQSKEKEHSVEIL